MRIIDRAVAAMALLVCASPGWAMDDQAIFWKVDGMAEHRFHNLAPATEWKGTAWIGDDSTKLRLFSSGVFDDSGRIDGEGGTKGIDNRLFYSRLISDFWDAKAGVQVTAFGPNLTRTAFIAGFEGLAPYGFRVDAVASITTSAVLMGRRTSNITSCSPRS